MAEKGGGWAGGGRSCVARASVQPGTRLLRCWGRSCAPQARCICPADRDSFLESGVPEGVRAWFEPVQGRVRVRSPCAQLLNPILALMGVYLVAISMAMAFGLCSALFGAPCRGCVGPLGEGLSCCLRRRPPCHRPRCDPGQPRATQGSPCQPREQPMLRCPGGLPERRPCNFPDCRPLFFRSARHIQSK